MQQVKAKVLKNEEISEGYFRLSIEAPEISQNAAPGQFVMLKVGNSYDPLLRRPFSIHKINKNGIEVLYKVIGKGTGMMGHIKPEEGVDLIGPLGNGFSSGPDIKEALIVGGGIGAAPLLALAEELKNKVKKITVFLGGRGRHDILCVEEFEEVGAEVKIATDDGSLGHKGFVTEILEQHLRQPQGTAPTPDFSLIYSCGPHMMSKKVAGISSQFNIPCQVSLEAHMACGVGACLGCVIKTKKGTILTPPNPHFDKEGVPKEGELPSCGCDSNFVSCDAQGSETSYKRVCMEGPVFVAEEVVWD